MADDEWDANRMWDIKLHLKDAARSIQAAVNNAKSVNEGYPEIADVMALGAIVDRIIERVTVRMESIEPS